MANGISSRHIDIDGEKIPLIKTQARLHAIVAPMSAAKGARKNIGKTGTINPSTAPVIADTGKVRTATTIAQHCATPRDLAPETATNITKMVTNTDRGPSTKNRNALFIEVTPRPGRSGIARHPCFACGRAGGCQNTRRPPSPVLAYAALAPRSTSISRRSALASSMRFTSLPLS